MYDFSMRVVPNHPRLMQAHLIIIR
jgi:hypothetical protein